MAHTLILMKMMNRWMCFGLLLAASCSPGQERGPGHYVDQIKLGGLNREYILRVPQGYKTGTPTPVVIALHGLWGNMNAFATETKIEELADKEGFICVVPNGLPTSGRGWNTGFFSIAGTKDDVDFMKEILDRVEKEFTVDKKREYVFGHSNGAMMAYYLGGLMSDRFAAVAGISGTIGIPKSSTAIKCVPDPKQPISVLMIHGEKDNMVAFKPGDSALLQCTGATEGAQWWAKVDGCSDQPVTTDFMKDLSTSVTYSKGKDGTEVRLIYSHNATHNIPGIAQGIDSIKEIWDFFKSHPKS